MDNTILVALISSSSVLIAALVPQILVYFSNKKEIKFERQRNKLLKYIETVQSYYLLEKLYTEKIAELDLESTPEIIKRQFRTVLREEHDMNIESKFSAPSSTKRDSEQLIENY